MKILKPFIIVLLLVLALADCLQAQKDVKATFFFEQLPLIPIKDGSATYTSKITTEQNEVGYANRFQIGELVSTGKESSAMGHELAWADKEEECKQNFMAIEGLSYGGGGIAVKLHFGNLNIHSKVQSKEPFTKTPGGKLLYSYTFVYGVEERLSVVDAQGNVLLDSILGSGADKKSFKYDEGNTHLPYGGSLRFTVLEHENKEVFPKVKSILDNYFGTLKLKALVEIQGFKSDLTELNATNEELRSLIDNKDTKEISKESVVPVLAIYEKYLAEASTDKKAKINPKTTEILRYNMALCFYLTEDYENAILQLSFDEDNIPKNKPKGGKGFGNFMKGLVDVRIQAAPNLKLSDLFRRSDAPDLKINNGKELYAHISNINYRKTINKEN